MDTQRPPLAQAIDNTTRDMSQMIIDMQQSQQKHLELELEALQLQEIAIQRQKSTIQRRLWKILQKIQKTWRPNTDEMPPIQQPETPGPFHVDPGEMQRITDSLTRGRRSIEDSGPPTTQFENIVISTKPDKQDVALVPTTILSLDPAKGREEKPLAPIETTYVADDANSAESMIASIGYALEDHAQKTHLPGNQIEMNGFMIHYLEIHEIHSYPTATSHIPFCKNDDLPNDAIKIATLLL